MKKLTLGGWVAGCLGVVSLLGMAATTALVTPAAKAAEKRKISGPPPIVYTEFPNACARCHKSDGRGGPAYGGFAKDLRETELDHESMVYIIEEGIRDRGMPEFKSTLTKREIEGLATYIEERIKGVYFDQSGNRITPEEAAALTKGEGAASN